MSTAVLFDVDGTLVDTPAGMTLVLRQVVAEYGGATDEARLRATVGRPLVASLALLLGLPSAHADAERAADRARELFTELVIPSARDLVLPGVPELLDGLRETGRPVAVVTSKVHRSAVELLEAAGLLSHFDVLACHGMVDRGKPHPDLALLAADRLGVAPADCVVVGDAVDDMAMARAAGMTALGVATGVATTDELLAAGAGAVHADAVRLGEALLPLGSLSR